MDDHMVEGRFQVLHFKVQDVSLCINLENVNKVLPLALLEIVPNSPPYFAGLMNLAGKSIPVIDLALRLGMLPTKKYSLDAPVLLCSNNFYQTAIIIDQVIGLESTHTDLLQMRAEFNKQESPFLAAVTLQSELVLLLNARKILAVDTASKTNKHNPKQLLNIEG